MSLNEILEQLPKLSLEEKQQLLGILEQELEESPAFLAELDARLRALDSGTARTYSLAEARQRVLDTRP